MDKSFNSELLLGFSSFKQTLLQRHACHLKNIRISKVTARKQNKKLNVHGVTLFCSFGLHLLKTSYFTGREQETDFLYSVGVLRKIEKNPHFSPLENTICWFSARKCRAHSTELLFQHCWFSYCCFNSWFR